MATPTRNPKTNGNGANGKVATPADEKLDYTADDIFGSALPGYADKERLAKERTRFVLHEVGTRIDDEYGEQWVLTIMLDGATDPELMTLLVHEKRDPQMLRAQQLIARTGPIENLCLRKSGDAFYINRTNAKA